MNTPNRTAPGPQSTPNAGFPPGSPSTPAPQSRPPGQGNPRPGGRPSGPRHRGAGYRGGAGGSSRCMHCGAELNHADLNQRATAGGPDRDWRFGMGRASDSGRNTTWPHRPFIGKGPKGYNRTDERIREEICERLSNGQIDASEIEVIVHDGAVILTGLIPDRQSKRLAEELADCSAGIKDIENRLQVQRGPAKKTEL